jgi:uncharacterized protein
MPSPRLIILQPTPYCNVNCTYCYLGHRDDRRLMSSSVIDAICEKIISRLPADAAPNIVWHAGEPTAAPISWYRDAYRRLSKACPRGTTYAMQSNGVAIDDRWVDFFRETNTNVGLSIDGPQRFHDARRRTRSGGPTWSLAVRALKRLRDAGLPLSVITVLHPDGLDCANEYYRFYRDNGVAHVSFSIDEKEGANAVCSFSGTDYKNKVVLFLVELLENGFREGFPLYIREVERIAQVLAGVGGTAARNEQVEAWDAVVVAADGSVSTFSPEFMEVRAPDYGNFVFGNVLSGGFDDFSRAPAFRLADLHVQAGVNACRSSCGYFSVCRGGSPVNKFCERNDLTATETAFCRYSTQAAADALLEFLSRQGRRPAFQRFDLQEKEVGGCHA